MEITTLELLFALVNQIVLSEDSQITVSPKKPQFNPVHV